MFIRRSTFSQCFIGNNTKQNQDIIKFSVALGFSVCLDLALGMLIGLRSVHMYVHWWPTPPLLKAYELYGCTHLLNRGEAKNSIGGAQ